jgi:predicted nucleotidyltransferase
MKKIVDEIARKLRDELKKSIADFEGLYVFGSQVRDDATEDSDVDMVVLFANKEAKKRKEYYEILSKLMADYYGIIDLDVHRRTREELERNYSFHEEVVDKGVFYGA